MASLKVLAMATHGPALRDSFRSREGNQRKARKGWEYMACLDVEYGKRQREGGGKSKDKSCRDDTTIEARCRCMTV